MALRILLLHAVGDPSALRRTTLNQAFCMPKHAPWHDYTLHALAHDPKELEGCEFDAILLDTTFLCQRWIRPRELFDQLLGRYDFVRRSHAVKLAFPQDDYDHSAILDRWLSDWGVDVVFSPLTRFAQVLYPRTSTTAEIVPSLTGYVDPIDIAILSKRGKPFEARGIDVGYRANDLPPQFGRAGRLKSSIGHVFADGLPDNHGLVLDISTNPADTLAGDAWLDFLGDCRFFVGSASGSSLVDADGAIKDCVLRMAREAPDATFEEVEAACFPGLDGLYQMTALGPRHLECAVARTCQVLVPDDGLLPLQPGRHYIPIAADGSDMERVLADMRDTRGVQERIAAAHALLVESPEFGYPAFAARIEGAIAEHRAKSRRAPVDPLPTAASVVRPNLPHAPGTDPGAREPAILLALMGAELASERRESARLFQENDHLARENDRLRRHDVARDERVSQLEAELQATRSAAESASRSAALRRGARGALRELARVNDYLEQPDGPARKAPFVIAYRGLRAWRRDGLPALLDRVRARLAWLVRDAADSRDLAGAAQRKPEPRTVTMLVPDDRIDRRVLLSARSLQQGGWRVTVVAAPFPEAVDGDRASFPDVRIVRIDTSRRTPPPALPADVEAQLAQHGAIYDYHGAFLREALRQPASVYVAHDLPVLPAAALAARALGSGLAYDAHELYSEQHCFTPEQKAAFERAERELARLPRLVTTVNESIAREMAQRHGIAQPDVIWNAPDANPDKLPVPGRGVLSRELGIPASKRIVLFQGSLSDNRNIESLVRAMRHVRTSDAVLVVMGPGDRKRSELQAIASESALGDERVRFAPVVPQDRLLDYTASADVGVIPYPAIDLNSIYCTPNKLFEYIVAGIPILANDLPELRRFVADSGFGIVRDLSTPESIAAAIDELLGQDLEPVRLCLRQRQHEFVWSVQGRRLAELYNSRFALDPANHAGPSTVCAESQA